MSSGGADHKDDPNATVHWDAPKIYNDPDQ
jgi:hypothetical protein